jgi:SAM-dependent methyltransferase
LFFGERKPVLSFDDVLPGLSEKWSEVPAGSDQAARVFSDQMLGDPALLARWDALNAEGAELRSWWWGLYAELFRSRKVLEIGSGLGFDAVQFAQSGARWTCCDIAGTNLEIIRKVAAAKGQSIDTLLIQSLGSFNALPADFDFVWCNGSLLHLPFDAAREECAAIIAHLKPGGRWIELAYPRERWVREGTPSFSDWGKLTDGERTPWVEWYDMEKLKERLYPARLKPLLEYRFSSDSFVWLDAEVVSRHGAPVQPALQLDAPAGMLVAAPGLWREAWSMPLRGLEATLAVTVDVECMVEAGSIGFALARDGRPMSREAIVESRTGSQLVHITTSAFGHDIRLVARNCSALGGGRFRVVSIRMRPAL